MRCVGTTCTVNAQAKAIHRVWIHRETDTRSESKLNKYGQSDFYRFVCAAMQQNLTFGPNECIYESTRRGRGRFVHSGRWQSVTAVKLRRLIETTFRRPKLWSVLVCHACTQYRTVDGSYNSVNHNLIKQNAGLIPGDIGLWLYPNRKRKITLLCLADVIKVSFGLFWEGE